MGIDGTVFEATSFSGIDGITHGFFTREGGVSGGVYDSLNCGYGSGDDRAFVSENRRRIAGHLGARHDDVVTLYQVHSATALAIDRPFPAGSRPKADALVTKTPGLAIGALAADCAPVLFADPEARVIGAAHSGWRGAISGILAATVDAMVALGADRGRIRAAVGPTIHQAAYEVGPEFESQFLEVTPTHARFFSKPTARAKAHFDLPGFCMHQLAETGIGQVETIGKCTYENESLLFSYRRKTHLGENDYGRQISAIVLN